MAVEILIFKVFRSPPVILIFNHDQQGVLGGMNPTTAVVNRHYGGFYRTEEIQQKL